LYIKRAITTEYSIAYAARADKRLRIKTQFSNGARDIPNFTGRRSGGRRLVVDGKSVFFVKGVALLGAKSIFMRNP